jgi:hypothetical protein
MYMAHSPCFAVLPLLPLLIPLFSLSNPLSLTWNPPSCDRIRPPRSQVACKLTSPSQPSPQPSPLQIPITQITLRLTKTTLRRIRRLLSRTVCMAWLGCCRDMKPENVLVGRASQHKVKIPTENSQIFHKPVVLYTKNNKKLCAAHCQCFHLAQTRKTFCPLFLLAVT